VRFAKLLGVDSAPAAAWQAALDAMPPYPSADFTFAAGAPGSEFNGGAGYLVEAAYGHHPGMAPNGSAATPPQKRVMMIRGTIMRRRTAPATMPPMAAPERLMAAAAASGEKPPPPPPDEPPDVEQKLPGPVRPFHEL
jgi:hypothetical protein